MFYHPNQLRDYSEVTEEIGNVLLPLNLGVEISRRYHVAVRVDMRARPRG
jgi:hypothetical protein